jgi:hypothetical protein
MGDELSTNLERLRAAVAGRSARKPAAFRDQKHPEPEVHPDLLKVECAPETPEIGHDSPVRGGSFFERLLRWLRAKG